MRVRLLGLISMLTLLLAAGVDAAPMPGDPVFGVVEAHYRPEQAAALGVTWERLTFAWEQFQPNNADEFNDSVIGAGYLGNGRQIVGLVKGVPGWASRSGAFNDVPAGVDLPFDDPNNRFGAFMRRLVGHYAPLGVHHWIIMNEPDIRPGEGTVEFPGEVEDYFHVLRTAYLAAKSVDPNAHIQVAGLTWWYDVNFNRAPFLERLLQVISRDPNARANNWYFDGISLHIYFTTSTVWTITQANRDILNRYGLGHKQVWLTEFNASPRRDPVTPINAPFMVSLEQQADYIVQASALALAAGAQRLAVYRLFDDNFVNGQTEPWGLLRSDGSPRPAFNAYQQVIGRFRGVGEVRRFAAGGGTLVTATYGDSTLYVLWNDTLSPGQFVIGAGGLGGDQTVYDAPGNAQTVALAPEGLVIDAPPAERIDLPDVVVAGAVRLVILPGGIRDVRFRSEAGEFSLT